jgi:hypothetical protein
MQTNMITKMIKWHLYKAQQERSSDGFRLSTIHNREEEV